MLATVSRAASTSTSSALRPRRWRGLLAGLGATADRPLDHGASALSDVGVVDLSPALAALGETELIGVVPHGELNQQLLGLRGISLRTEAPAWIQDSVAYRRGAGGLRSALPAPSKRDAARRRRLRRPRLRRLALGAD